MTYTEFLQRLAETPRDWRLAFNGSRSSIENGSRTCPIVAAWGGRGFAWWKMPRMAGIDERVIADAADERGEYDRQVRADLLRACGLSEDEQGKP